MINQLNLSQHRMDWYAGENLPADQFPQALASAAKYFAVKYGIAPSRAWIHKSQLSGQLALAAKDLGIVIIEISIAYNINHILLSIGEDHHGKE